MTNERPSQYDGTQYLIHLELPSDLRFTVADVYDYVYGVQLNDGAKPWPYYRDAVDQQWWSASSPTSKAVHDRLVWMIDLDQLAHRPRSEARGFLQDVLYELRDRVEKIGAVLEPECTVPEAVEMISRVVETLRVRDYEVRVIVAAPEGNAYRVAEWWEALEGVGLEIGDGNLFWMYDPGWDEAGNEPDELFCAEPCSEEGFGIGYFHRGDLNRTVAFPRVALHFRARDFRAPSVILRRMAQIAEQMAKRLGAKLVTEVGNRFELVDAEAKLARNAEQMKQYETRSTKSE